MIHYTCDRCQRSIDPEEGPRYVVRIELELIAATTDEADETDSVDFLAELQEALEQESLAAAMADECDEPLDYLHEALSRGDDLDHLSPTGSSNSFGKGHEPLSPSFDLCPNCHAAYLKNPLGREQSLKLHFSNN